MEYFGDEGERLQMMFNFQVNQHLFYALAAADTRLLVQSLNSTKPRPATAQWGQFLRNHDELDLGRLTPQQRKACFAAFAPEKNMQLYNRGIRRRLAPMLHGDRRRLEMAYSLMLSLPGTPVIRYGDEIGMGDDLSLPERNSVRTPMQWSNDPQGGFTSNPHPQNPVITGGTYGYEHINVADQRRDPNSFMNWTERMIRTRKQTPEIGWGDFTVIPSRRDDVLILCYTWQDNSVVLIHNFSADPVDLSFRSSAITPKRAGKSFAPRQFDTHLTNIISNDHSRADSGGHHIILLEPYGYRWFRVGHGDALHRSNI
jgi:maltose alpha-D-glucosyltransferase/alpha-amylase